jgi:RHS repeat-associated protein
VVLESPDADFEYDRNRRRIRSTRVHKGKVTTEVTEYFWDCRGRLREVDLPSGEKVLYTYDAFGRRVRKEIVPTDRPPGEVQSASPRVRVVEFLWDGDALAQEVDTQCGKRTFVHEPYSLVPMLQQEKEEVFTYVNDHLGTPKELIGQDGRVAWTAAHTVWGKIAECAWDPSSVTRDHPIESPFRLLGQYADVETGLCHTRFRYFDPDRGRWISPDPIGVAGGANLFGFNGTPTSDVDPLGLCAEGKPKGYTAIFQMQLETDDLGRSRSVHFNRANAALEEAMLADPNLAQMMESLVPGVSASISSVGGREDPEGWTWHHTTTEEGGDVGVMRLVPTDQHTPGSEFWNVLHQDPGGAGGYSQWAIPAGAPPN